VNDIAANQSQAEGVVKEIKSMGRSAIAVTADVSNLSEVQKLVETSVNELGPLNTMVANAGIAQVKALLDLTEEDLKRMFEINGMLTLFGSLAIELMSRSLRCVQLLLHSRQTDDQAGQGRQTSRRRVHRSFQAVRSAFAL
jgi:NAD(P)-dependent dehydrogenase (short-subunit alcohol dehydrogenase family)